MGLMASAGTISVSPAWLSFFGSGTQTKMKSLPKRTSNTLVGLTWCQASSHSASLGASSCQLENCSSGASTTMVSLSFGTAGSRLRACQLE